jgi:DNA invertase Pin-like site-specific DNA recombinase
MAQDQSKSTRVCIFARVSTERQDCFRQITELRRFAEEKGYQVTSEILSKVSGSKIRVNRPDIRELLYEAENGKFDKVLCSEVSRLGRNASDVKATLASLHALGIPIIFYGLGCLESLDQNGNESFCTNIILAIYGELSQEERRLLSDRTISGLKAARLKGTILGRPSGKMTVSELMQKHSKIVKFIKAGRTISETAKLSGRGYNTVKRVALHLRSNEYSQFPNL